MADVRDSLDLGDLYHIGIAVNDIDRGIERLAALGMTAGPVFELLVPSLYRGKRTEAGVKAVFAPLGVIAIELVEPTGGESSIATFLHEHGEGVQHFGYRVDDLKSTIERAETLNIEVEWLVSDEHGPAVAFLSPDILFGMNVELVRKQPQINLQVTMR